MQFLIRSKAEQEKHNDEPLPFTLALQSFFENEDELAAILQRRASIILKIAEDMCSGPERTTLTNYGLNFFFIRAGAGIENKIAAFECTLERHEHSAGLVATQNTIHPALPSSSSSPLKEDNGFVDCLMKRHLVFLDPQTQQLIFSMISGSAAPFFSTHKNTQ